MQYLSETSNEELINEYGQRIQDQLENFTIIQSELDYILILKQEILRRLALVSKWFSIETAPKNATRVILYIPGFRGDKIWTGFRLNINYEKQWCYSGGILNKDEQPTHWMPLPKPPEE